MALITSRSFLFEQFLMLLLCSLAVFGYYSESDVDIKYFVKCLAFGVIKFS